MYLLDRRGFLLEEFKDFLVDQSKYLKAQDKFNSSVERQFEELRTAVDALLDYLGLKLVRYPEKVVVEKKKKGGGS